MCSQNITIDIALASDEGYVCGLIVTAASLAMHASRNVVLHFHVLDCGISDESYKEIIKRVTVWHPQVFFSRHHISDDMLKEFPAWHGGKSIYARLYLADLLPKLSYVIYCDVDFLWLSDVKELWENRGNEALVSVKDASQATIISEETWHRQRGISFTAETYFCSGLCFMNLDRFRQKAYGRKAMQFVMDHPDIRFPDQAALNYVLRGDVKLVDKKWQQLTGLLDDEACRTPCVFHYAGDTPWKRKYLINMITDAVLLWHSYNAKICGISVWRSLRCYFSVFQILYRRLLWHIVANEIARKTLCLVLRVVGKYECCNYIVDAYKPLKWRLG